MTDITTTTTATVDLVAGDIIVLSTGDRRQVESVTWAWMHGGQDEYEVRFVGRPLGKIVAGNKVWRTVARDAR